MVKILHAFRRFCVYPGFRPNKLLNFLIPTVFMIQFCSDFASKNENRILAIFWNALIIQGNVNSFLFLLHDCRKQKYLHVPFSVHTLNIHCVLSKGCRGHDHMVGGFTTTYAISAYHHWCCEFESLSGQSVQHLTVTGRWFSPRPPLSSTNKTDRHNTTEIMLKVGLNTIKQTIFYPYTRIAYI